MRMIRLGTRGSLLALAQSRRVAAMLESHWPDLRVELIPIRTSGDAVADRPLREIGGKGLFTRELELALLDGRIDLAVHSYKDVPVTMPLVAGAELWVAAVPAREDARDVLIARQAKTVAALPPHAQVATGSLRRQCQLLAARPDLRIEPIRGNIDTRLRKWSNDECDALILAAAGLLRSGLFDPAVMTPVATDELLPAAGQGALALQVRRNSPAAELCAPLHDPASGAAVATERELVRLLSADCDSPVGALATIENGQLLLQAIVGGRGGEGPLLRARASGLLASPTAVAADVYAQLCRQGVEAILHPSGRDAPLS